MLVAEHELALQVRARGPASGSAVQSATPSATTESPHPSRRGIALAASASPSAATPPTQTSSADPFHPPALFYHAGRLMQRFPRER